MKKLFLCSSFEDVANYLPEFASNDLKGKTITFIPTASLPEKVDFYVKAAKQELEEMGLTVDELEVTTAEPSEIKEKLQSNDFIYVSGGNTFFLLQELRRVGADKLIAEQIEAGKVYIGESAGSLILAPNIEYVKQMDDCGEAPDLASFDALNVVDFYQLPHLNSFPFEEAVEKIISEYDKTIPLKPFTNAQVILIDGDKVEVKG